MQALPAAAATPSPPFAEKSGCMATYPCYGSPMSKMFGADESVRIPFGVQKSSIPRQTD